MAHNTRTRADWITGAIPTEAEFDDIDQKTFTAINGDAGGTWAPAASIILGGLGMRMDALLQMNAPIAMGGPSGTGRLVERIDTLGPGNLVFPGIGAYGFVGRITGAVVGAVVYTLGDASAVSGDTVTFYCEPGFTGSAQIWSDGDLLYTVGFNNADDGPWATFVFLGTWRLWKAPIAHTHYLDINTVGPASVVVSDNVRFMLIEGWGGGGGGGAAGTVAGGILSRRGGGGGAGAPHVFSTLVVTPGETLAITIGAGGLGGDLGFSGRNGENGEATSIVGTGGSRYMKGGGGGRFYGDTSNATFLTAEGGGPGTPAASLSVIWESPVSFQSGGHGGIGGDTPLRGNGKYGGASGLHFGGSGGGGGAPDGAHPGGGGGGGGGAGPAGNGGNGGAGGAGNASGVGLIGVSGGGVGGGGGGGGGGAGASGAGSTGSAGGLPGGNGANGAMRLMWVK